MKRAAFIALACIVVASCGGDTRIDTTELGGATARDLLFVRGGAGAGIYALDFQTGGERLVALNGREPAWSPDGTRIAYTREEENRRRGTYNRLWIVNADGSKSRRLVDAKAASPAWSPDGTKIAFVGRTGVDVVDAARGEVQALKLEPKVPLDVAWAPNGLEFAISGFDGIYVAPTDGSPPRRLTRGDLDGSPAWSPDGKQLLFDRSDGLRSGRRGVFVVDADGTHLRGLTEDFYDSEASWSPDGKTIVFARNDSLEKPSASSELYAIDADGGTPTQLTRNRVFDGSPAWRPVGRRP